MTDRPIPPHRRLRLAAELVKSVAESLNTRSSACPTCGLPRFESLPDARLHPQLAAVAEKLERWSKQERWVVEAPAK